MVGGGGVGSSTCANVSGVKQNHNKRRQKQLCRKTMKKTTADGLQSDTFIGIKQNHNKRRPKQSDTFIGITAPARTSRGISDWL
jgi:hypothetical protein